MRKIVGWGIVFVCIVAAIIGIALDSTSANINLDSLERLQKEYYTDLVEQRRVWMKDIFRYHDVAAMAHIFFAFLFTGLFNSAVGGLLIAYLYESAMFTYDIYKHDATYFTRMPDSLIQDPVQAAIGAAAIMLMWKGQHLERMSELAQKNKWKCVFVTIGTWPGDWGLGLGPGLSRMLVRFPVCVFIVWLAAKNYAGTDDRATTQNSILILLTAWVPLVLAHGMSYYAMRWELVDPFQSTVLWSVLLLALMALWNPARWLPAKKRAEPDQGNLLPQCEGKFELVALRL
jgi:hypothetical protein